MERLTCNAALTALPMAPEGKGLHDPDDNVNDACKKNREDHGTCCTGTRPLLMLELLRLLWLHNDGGLYAAQYAPAAVRWAHQGRAGVHASPNIPIFYPNSETDVAMDSGIVI